MKNDDLELKAEYLKKSIKNIINRYFANLHKNKINEDFFVKNVITSNDNQDELEIMIKDDPMI